MGTQDGWSDMGVGQNRRILVVDNETRMRLATALFLQREGYQASTAKSGAEALRMMKSEGVPDLILLDITMPVMDGFALAYEIRKYSKVPIIVVSSNTDPDAKVAALIEFAEDYLSKPCHLEELSVRIWRILTHYPPQGMHDHQTETGNDVGCNRRRNRRGGLQTAAPTGHRSRAAGLPCTPAQARTRPHTHGVRTDLNSPRYQGR